MKKDLVLPQKTKEKLPSFFWGKSIEYFNETFLGKLTFNFNSRVSILSNKVTLVSLNNEMMQLCRVISSLVN